MLVEDAAKTLGMSPQTLRLALRQKLFSFGVAVKTSENRWTYYINPKRLERYLNGEDSTYIGDPFTNYNDGSYRSHVSSDWKSPRREFS